MSTPPPERTWTGPGAPERPAWRRNCLRRRSAPRAGDFASCSASADASLDPGSLRAAGAAAPLFAAGRAPHIHAELSRAARTHLDGQLEAVSADLLQNQF